MSYKGQRDTSSTSLAEQKDTAKSDKGLEDLVNSLEEMFRQVLLKIDKAPERRGGYSSRSPSPSRRDGSPMRCFQCNEEGHFKRDCPNRKRVSFNMPKTMKLITCGDVLTWGRYSIKLSLRRRVDLGTFYLIKIMSPFLPPLFFYRLE